MRWILLALLMPLFLHAAEDGGKWSEPVKGLKARLLISPLKLGEDGHYHFILYFQLERKDNGGNLLDVAYTPSALALKVIDQDEKTIPWQSAPGNREEGPWKPLILPRDASMAFSIGRSIWAGSDQYLGEYLFFDSSFDEWMIPPHSAKAFYLAGEFVIPATQRDFSNVDYVWSGKLVLPKIAIPKIP